MRWWFWMIYKADFPGGPLKYHAAGPYQMNTYDAWMMEFRTQSDYLRAKIYRWVWDPTTGWVWDDRNSPELLAAA